ncbi:MAG: Flp family type IVb pilin [Gemmatimonadota bacterium]
MHAFLTRLWKDDSGQDLIEYVLLAALIAVVAIVIIDNIGQKVQNGYQAVTDNMNQAPFK